MKLKVKDVIQRVDEVKPNAFDEQRKLEWIGALEGRILADVMLMSPAELEQQAFVYPDDMERELVVKWPHSDIYEQWLGAKIDEANGEYTKYQNSMAVYNETWGNFVRWFGRVYEPAQGYETGVRRWW